VTFATPDSNESAANVVVGPVVVFRKPVAFPPPTDHRYQSGINAQSGEFPDQAASRLVLLPDRIQKVEGVTTSSIPESFSEG